MTEPIDPGLRDLDTDLRLLAAEVAFPPTPDILAAVRARLGARPTGGVGSVSPGSMRPPVAGEPPVARAPAALRPRRLARSLLLAAALLLLVAAAALGSFVILRGLAIVPVETVPSSSPGPIPSGSPGAGLDLGRAVAQPALAAEAGFLPLVPAGPLPSGVPLGPPDTTWVATDADSSRVAMVWAAQPGLPAAGETGVGLLVDELIGSTSQVLVTKLVGADTVVEPIALADGTPAYWITGGPHLVMYRAPGGEIRDAAGRLAADTLVFNRGDLLVRVETAAGLATAVAVADSLR